MSDTLIEVPTAEDPLAQRTTRPLEAADVENVRVFDAAYERVVANKILKPHVMIDLETFGTGDNVIPISLGAVKFHPLDRHLPMESFHVGIDPESCERLGLKIECGTALWWMDPERQEAFKQWFAMLKFELPMALDGFGQWFGNESLPVWGNGVGFDNRILRQAYRACGMTPPWDTHHDDRCFRTFKNLHPGVRRPKRLGTVHNALHDAVHQVQWFHEITKFGDFEEIV